MAKQSAVEIPVYLFTGFLEAGKTKFINETLSDPRFNQGEPTLVLQMEEGEEEIDLTGKEREKVTVETITEESALTPDPGLPPRLRRSGAERVLIEYNGMWQLASLYNALPDSWMIYQQIAFFDSTTVRSYNANMRSLVVDKLQNADLVVFNRMKKDGAADSEETMALHKLVRGLSRQANIIYEAEDGSIRYDEIEDPLPFDLDAPVVEIENRDFALFMRDLTEDFEKYDGKTVKFTGIIAKGADIPGDSLVIGRHIMTCCEADIAYNGLACVTDKAASFNTYDWATVTAKIKVEKHKVYRAKGPVLHALEIEKCAPLAPGGAGRDLLLKPRGAAAPWETAPGAGSR